jgi:quercetin dioxygenase-like cupin family protein
MAAITTRPGEGERYVRENRVVTVRADLPELSIHEIEFDRTFAVPAHRHEHVDAMVVLEVEVLAGDELVRAGPGTVLAVPAGTVPGFSNPGPADARILVFHAPDGGFAELVRNT